MQKIILRKYITQEPIITKIIRDNKYFGASEHITVESNKVFIMMNFYIEKNIIYCEIVDQNERRIVMAKATCKPGDHFDVEVGCNIAEARAKAKFYTKMANEYIDEIYED